MKNVFRCVYGDDTKSKNAFDLNKLFIFKLELLDDRMILKSNNKQALKQREFWYSQISDLELSLAIGNYSPAVTVNKVIRYFYDLKFQDGYNEWVLEFRYPSDFIDYLNRLKELKIEFADPIGIYSIITTMDRLQVEKYFIHHAKELESNYNITVYRDNNDYVTD